MSGDSNQCSTCLLKSNMNFSMEIILVMDIPTSFSCEFRRLIVLTFIMNETRKARSFPLWGKNQHRGKLMGKLMGCQYYKKMLLVNDVWPYSVFYSQYCVICVASKSLMQEGKSTNCRRWIMSNLKHAVKNKDFCLSTCIIFLQLSFLSVA